MEFSLQSLDGAFPCEITVDEDNGRFMLRKADTSGEVFNTMEELIQWMEQNWHAEQFTDPQQYNEMMLNLKRHMANKDNTVN
ncbi:hypothetical protein [Bacillus sp. CGMCC 1.16541]|uniref:hypothetical protein n=1 Tax=Bacillus sp. CGMCC 1.16541 TaxID=2185143 RepID=UPI000D729427|nr:hypothetical protein [Bacillus sp. CGMCC 1.16541]